MPVGNGEEQTHPSNDDAAKEGAMTALKDPDVQDLIKTTVDNALSENKPHAGGRRRSRRRAGKKSKKNSKKSSARKSKKGGRSRKNVSKRRKHSRAHRKH